MQKLLKIEEAADLLQCSRQLLYLMVEQDLIPHVRISRLIRFEEKELLSWFKDGRFKKARQDGGKLKKR